MEDDKPLAMAPAQVALHNLGDLVKSNLAAVVAAAIVVVVLAILYFTTEGLQSPEAKLNSQIDVEVEKAKRMLADYNPVGQRVMAVMDAAQASSTQPMAESVAEDQWPASLKTLQERLDSMVGEVEPLNTRFRTWSGESSMTGPAASYSELKEQLEKNLAQVSEALGIVRAAVSMSAEAGDRTISGRDHPVATRLEAVLIYHQADLLNRKAAVRRDDAAAAREQFERAGGQWQMLQSQIAAIEAVAHGEAVSAPASADAPAASRAVPAKATAKPPKKTVAAGKPGVVSRLTGLLFGKQKPDATPAEPSTTPEPAPLDADRETKEPIVESPEPPAPTVVVKPPTPQQRLSELAAQREQAVAQIAAAEADVARLRDHVSALEQALAGARQTARDAQLRMTQLEEKGIDPTEPDAIERFTNDYQKASNQYRAALREAGLIENGGIRNARPDTEDEREFLKAPLVSVDPAQPMKPTEGLISVRKRLEAAEAQLDATKNLLASIDTQVAAVQRRQSNDSDRLASLQNRQAALKELAAQAIRDAAAATAEADKLARDAIELLNGEGRQAAQNARTAADNQIRDARNKQQPGVENPRLETIAKSGILVGSAQTLEGDIALLTAYVQAARVSDLLSHAQVLRHAEVMGVGPESQEEAAHAYKAAAASEEAEKARKEGIAVAREAYNSYREASTALDNLWVLNANAAAVCYLLSSLQTGDEADKSLDLAIQIYNQALQGRSDRKDIGDYRRALDGLSRLQQARTR
ncbi:MAG: hypothetical protein QUV05_11520 [Phycisphaerae bacterium]|nr:hypothetical protein [Phycisphaerae bacterium]